jgi:hypothetical protein
VSKPAEPAGPAQRRNFLKGPLDAIGRIPVAIRAVSAALVLIAALLTAANGALITGSELPNSYYKFINTIHPGPKPSHSIVFVSSDQVLALSSQSS